MSKEGWVFQHGTSQRIGQIARSLNGRHEKTRTSIDLKTKEETKVTADWSQWFLWNRDLVYNEA